MPIPAVESKHDGAACGPLSSRGRRRFLLRAWKATAYFGASEATIFSKRGSPRSESQYGYRRS